MISQLAITNINYPNQQQSNVFSTVQAHQSPTVLFIVITAIILATTMTNQFI